MATEYCTPSDVTKRLTTLGLAYLADRDGDGAVSPGDEDDIISAAIEWAGTRVDFALEQVMATSTARGAGNAFLRHTATDIACYRLASVAGNAPPQVLTDAFETAIEELRAISNGARVPGLNYATATYGDGRSTRLPRIRNVRR